ncbi:squalene/phytoene synthase family protein [Alphaproteobacteria bacterium GH1-50]|uniref:Squalene/phytoene synthase family protein n=1 Tax=Kangsaoukella pontilimi TaxID=2691042 RepID=A0A7C9IEP6_9RHOB|nr:squalene/phytoene synthase family protein [Kangsaoukella pontilimi]MXQ06924.1 squalene/phytoene synthase family protein [Kangsaoukella pontilimi]
MSLQACADIVRQGDPDRFRAAMAAPVEARRALFPLYAFNVEVARAPWVTEEAMIAEMRLQWWRDVLEEIGRGGDVRRHEVATPLAEVVRGAGLDPETLDAGIAARRWDIYRDPFEDEAHFLDYVAKTGGGLMWASARALGASEDDEAVIRDVGIAMALANWFLAIPALEARGRRPLADGRADAVARLAAEEGLARLDSARSRSFGPAVPALRAAWLARPILSTVARNPKRVASGGFEPSEFRKSVTLAAKAIAGRW